MQTNPAKESNKEKKDHYRRDVVLKKLRSIFLENWGTKLMAIFIAVALWAGLITQDPSLTREKQFNGVDVNIIGEETLKRNGYIILEDLSEALSGVNVRVNVPQGQYAAVQPNNYSVRVDLSRIHASGGQEVRILSTNSATYGTVIEITPSTVKLTVDDYVTRYRIPVTVVTIGEVPEGYYATEPSLDPPVIAVSGPRTVVEKIASARVMVNQAELPAREGEIRRALPFSLIDASGEPIDSDMLEMTSEGVLIDTVIVDQTLYTARTVEFSELGLVVGEPAEGYEIKGVYLTPASVTIAGRESAINTISVMYAENNVNVRGLSQSVTKSLRVRQPSSIKYASTDMVNVAVEIGPVITSRAYEARVELQGLVSALREVGGTRTATVFLTGPQPWLESLSAADVTLTCDMSSIVETGTYTLPLSCKVKGSEGQEYTCEINPANVVVTVIER